MATQEIQIAETDAPGYVYPAPWTDVGRTAGETEGAFSLVAVLRDEKALGRAHDVEVRGELAFVPGKRDCFAVVDAADPKKPRVVSSITSGIENGETVLLHGPHRAHADVCLVGSRHLHAIDLRDPSHPKVTAHLTDASINSINGMVFWDAGHEFAVAASKRGHVNVFDVRDPFQPRLHVAFETHQRGVIRSPHDVVLVPGGRIAIVDCSRGWPQKVAILKIADTDGGEIWPGEEWQVEGVVQGEEMDGANRVAYYGAGVQDALLVACNKSDRMATVNARDPRAPKAMTNFICPDVDPCGIHLAGHVLFVGAGQTLEALDVREPYAPRSLGWIRPRELFGVQDANAHDLTYRDGYVYITAQSDDSLGIVEVLDPEIRRLASGS